jgi:hypothetical protein
MAQGRCGLPTLPFAVVAMMRIDAADQGGDDNDGNRCHQEEYCTYHYARHERTAEHDKVGVSAADLNRRLSGRRRDSARPAGGGHGVGRAFPAR